MHENLAYTGIPKGTQEFLHCLFENGAFHVLKGISQNIFLQLYFFVVLNSTPHPM